MFRSTVNKAILLAVICVSAAFFLKYGMRSRPLYGDALGYYMYLPATFIYNNVDLMFDLPEDKTIDDEVRWYAEQMQKNKSETGKEVNQYTYGIAFMEMPFFFIAHITEKISGHEGTGFTDLYADLIKISSIFYALMGMIVLWRILRKYFTGTQSLAGIAILFTGTNLFWFTLHQAGMSHIPLFFLYAMLMLITIELHNNPRTVRFATLGLTIGLITIIRPTDILCALIPLLYNVYNRDTLRNKLLFIKEHRKKFLLLITSFLLPIIPQMLYWYATTGSFLFYSYQGQSFSHWKHPKIIEGLFYFSNGWLPYSPVMALSLVGLLLYKSIQKWAWCICIIFPLYVYIIYSWYCYNYINGLGSRPMIHLYPLLAIPMVAFLQFLSRKHLLIKVFSFLVVFVLVSVNIGFSRLQSLGLIRSEESNMVYNFRMFFKSRISYDDLFVKDLAETQPYVPELTKVGTLDCKNFDDSTSDHFIKDTVFHSRFYYRIQNEEYAPGISVTYKKRDFKDAKWFRCSGKFMYTRVPDYFSNLLVLDVTNKLWKGCKIENKIDKSLESYRFDHYRQNKWNEIAYFVRIPENMKDGDPIGLFIWSPGKTELYMDDLCLELYK